MFRPQFQTDFSDAASLSPSWGLDETDLICKLWENEALRSVAQLCEYTYHRWTGHLQKPREHILCCVGFDHN